MPGRRQKTGAAVPIVRRDKNMPKQRIKITLPTEFQPVDGVTHKFPSFGISVS